MIYLKKILKQEDNLFRKFPVKVYPAEQMKSDKPDSEIWFLILWVPHNEKFFHLQFFETKSYYPRKILEYMYSR